LKSQKEEDQSLLFSGLYVLMVGCFEKHINLCIKNINSPKNELKLLNVLKNIKSNLSNAKDISINDLVRWYENESANLASYYVRHADRINELQAFLSFQSDDQKQYFNKLITDYKSTVAHHRNKIAHGEIASIGLTDQEKFNSGHELIIKIIGIIP
jgi:hypothetical protein